MPHLTLILGGAASGKSRFAEQLVSEMGRPKVYIATAQAFDKEMEDKIALHKSMRGSGWKTVEAPLDPADAVSNVPAESTVLVDCATLWLSNIMLAEQDVPAATDRFVNALVTCAAPVIVVSNEIGLGIVPDNALGRAFRNAQGLLNQRLAEKADRVALVVAGLPLALKGSF